MSHCLYVNDMANNEIPILVLTGYLGSGKTTLVNHILSNRRGIKFAVIVNDIGEVNIDADLIEKGGVVDQKDDSLVALQNGCICCTLQTDLISQIVNLARTQRFDYIVIEASGICEPEPIARTICSIPMLGEPYTTPVPVRLDCVVTVVDVWRMQSEFGCGDDLVRENIDEEDIENLVIQQIEFCNIVLLNKASEVKPEEMRRIRQIVTTLQPSAEIIECDYANVGLDAILDTYLFDYGSVAASAGWIRGVESVPTFEQEAEARGEQPHEPHHHHHDDEEEHHHDDEDDDEGHYNDNEDEDDDEEHEGHHHHHHGEGETEEYGISSFVYYRRPPFDLNKFDNYVAKKWPKGVIRAKGLCYFCDEMDMSYLFEQAGKQKLIRQSGKWYATAPQEELAQFMEEDPGFARDWDEKWGDRMQKIVFIGQNMDREQITKDLDDCLAIPFPETI